MVVDGAGHTAMSSQGETTTNRVGPPLVVVSPWLDIAWWPTVPATTHRLPSILGCARVSSTHPTSRKDLDGDRYRPAYEARQGFWATSTLILWVHITRHNHCCRRTCRGLLAQHPEVHIWWPENCAEGWDFRLAALWRRGVFCELKGLILSAKRKSTPNRLQWSTMLSCAGQLAKPWKHMHPHTGFMTA